MPKRIGISTAQLQEVPLLHTRKANVNSMTQKRPGDQLSGLWAEGVFPTVGPQPSQVVRHLWHISKATPFPHQATEESPGSEQGQVRSLLP